MSDVKMKTILIRVQEWTAYLPQHKDPNGTQMALSQGVTGFEALENEKLLEVAVSATGTARSFPVPDPANPDGPPINVRHGCYAFQAVLASNFDGELPEGPVTDDTPKQAVVLPGSINRQARRAQGKN